MSKIPDFMIYGANGYTGELIVRYALRRNMKPLIAGRNEEAIKKMAKKYKLPHLVFSLEDKEALYDAVLSVKVVLHCAGPFIRTAAPMLRACIKNKTHYLDITGEIGVFERMKQLDDDIKEAGIMALPGVGFDVVPTDCLAAYLKKHLPSATHLTLAFAGFGGSISHGTATTMLENITEGGAVRRKGKIEKVPSAWRTKFIKFWNRPVLTTTIPWGDVSTAFHSTGIPNIEVYMAVSNAQLFMMQSVNNMKWILNSRVMKRFLQKRIDNNVDGPSDAKRQKGRSFGVGTGERR